VTSSVARPETPRAWDAPDYRRIVSAHTDRGTLYVLFANGSYASIEAARLVRPQDEGVRWEDTQASPREVTVPTDGEPIEISWVTLRALTDPAFNAYLVRRGEEEARRVGERLRTLRKARKLDGKVVAARAGITPQSLSRIERGHHEIVFSTLRKVLAALGCTLSDLSDDAEIELYPAAPHDAGAESTAQSRPGGSPIDSDDAGS